jgi:hypothetical protein
MDHDHIENLSKDLIQCLQHHYLCHREGFILFKDEDLGHHLLYTEEKWQLLIVYLHRLKCLKVVKRAVPMMRLVKRII